MALASSVLPRRGVTMDAIVFLLDGWDEEAQSAETDRSLAGPAQPKRSLAGGPSPVSLLDQLPRLSAYDPGAVGEGSLDPLGLGAIAERIADVLAPGLRARMSQPRFVTLSAVGALACQGLAGLSCDDGKTTPDIAFEWLVVEAMVRHAAKSDDARSRLAGLPGNDKAQRAVRSGLRLSRSTYLNGPRVFGFTGVYRPLSKDLGVLTSADGPGENAAALVRAWERDGGQGGFVDGIGGTSGGELRKDIADACRRTLEQAQCAAPPTGRLLRALAECLAPRGAGPHERAALRSLIRAGDHPVRNELLARLAADPPAADLSQADLAARLLQGASAPTRRALLGAIDYEAAATALDNAFRRLLAHATQQHGAALRPADALQAPGLRGVAGRIHDLVHRAIDSLAELGDVALSTQTQLALRLFARPLTPGGLLEALRARHEDVQASKRRLSWLDEVGGQLVVRVPYRQQSIDLDDATWAHPMRLRNLAMFLAETAP